MKKVSFVMHYRYVEWVFSLQKWSWMASPKYINAFQSTYALYVYESLLWQLWEVVSKALWNKKANVNITTVLLKAIWYTT